ncbi:MAG: hypothetical protein AAB546_00345, partial [Patescibacteria group bacterium]
MLSKWAEYKKEAMTLRRRGTSMTKIGRKWNIPKSTLSYWFKDIKLTDKQRLKLRQNINKAFDKARPKILAWHNKQKANNIR